MRAAIQRVKRARVTIGSTGVGEIGFGLVVLVGFSAGDGSEEMAWMAGKCVHLRICPDHAGRLHKSLLEIGGEILAVSQLTLCQPPRPEDRSLPRGSFGVRLTVDQPPLAGILGASQRVPVLAVQTRECFSSPRLSGVPLNASSG